MDLGSKVCLVCGTTLLLHQRLGNHLCGSPQCLFRYQTVDKNRCCSMCGRVLGPRELSDGLCFKPECQRQFAERQRMAEKKTRQEKLLHVAEAIRGDAVRAELLHDPQTFPITIIPHYHDELADLPAERRQTLLDYAQQLIEETFAKLAEVASEETAPVAVESPPEPAVPAKRVPGEILGAGCATCNGYCCRNGNDHAYLMTATMERILRHRPEISADELLQEYARHIPKRTLSKSCVFHGPMGCELPVDLRSDVCNEYFCTSMWDFQRAYRDSDDPKAMFCATEDDLAFDAIAFVAVGIHATAPVKPVSEVHTMHAGVADGNVEQGAINDVG